MGEVKRAMAHDKILIGHGTTNVYVAEELLGRDTVAELMNRNTYVSGIVVKGVLCTTVGEEKGPILVLSKGQVEPPAATMAEMLKRFGRNSLFIKGANAVDHKGKAAAFVAHPEGGTIGWAIGMLLAQGIKIIVPVGLEKLISSVDEAVAVCGQQALDYSTGLKVGLVPIPGARVVTEIQALELLAGVAATHVASGGSSGSEGSVVVVAEGEKTRVQKAIDIVESIKGEPPLQPRKGICASCRIASPAQPADYDVTNFPKRCFYEGMAEHELPEYLRNR
jgi:hypothetical protein